MENDAKKLVTDWKKGESVRVLTLGHSRDFRQSLAYECVFQVLDYFQKNSITVETIEEVNAVTDELAGKLELSTEERGAAASMAWLVLRNGWTRAIAGHADHKYLMLTREAKAA